MPESPLASPVREDVLAVTGHCCSVRLTHLPDSPDGIDFTPTPAVRAEFERGAGVAGHPAAASTEPAT